MSGSQNINNDTKKVTYAPLVFSTGTRTAPKVEVFKIDFMGKTQTQGSQPIPEGGIYASLSNGLNVELSSDYKSGSVFYPGPGAYTKVTVDPKAEGDKFSSAQYMAQSKTDLPYSGEAPFNKAPEAKKFESTVDVVGITSAGGAYSQSNTPIGDKQAEFLKKHQGEVKNGVYVEHQQDNIFTKEEADALLFGITTNPQLRKEAEEAGYNIIQKDEKTGFENADKVLVDTTKPLNPMLLPDSTVTEINKNNDTTLTKKELEQLQNRSYDSTRTTGELK